MRRFVPPVLAMVLLLASCSEASESKTSASATARPTATTLFDVQAVLDGPPPAASDLPEPDGPEAKWAQSVHIAGEGVFIPNPTRPVISDAVLFCAGLPAAVLPVAQSNSTSGFESSIMSVFASAPEADAVLEAAADPALASCVEDNLGSGWSVSTSDPLDSFDASVDDAAGIIGAGPDDLGYRFLVYRIGPAVLAVQLEVAFDLDCSNDTGPVSDDVCEWFVPLLHDFDQTAPRESELFSD